MASDPPGSSTASPRSESAHPSPREDAETTATRRELHKTSISESNNDAFRASTPDVPGEKVASKDQISSPKKKRPHDQVEDDLTTAASSFNVCVGSNVEIHPPPRV